MIRRVLLAAGLSPLLMLPAISDSCGGGDTDPPDGSVFLEYDVVAYDYTFDLATGISRSEVTLTALTDGDCISLDFRLSEVSEVTFDGIDADWFQAGGDLLELCGAEMLAGDTFTVGSSQTVPQETQDVTDVGYSVGRDASGGDFYYLVSWIEGCSLFGPCYDDPDDFAHYTFHVNHPSSHQLFCPGAITAGSTQSSCIFTLDGAPTYTGFGFLAAANRTKVALGTMAGVAVELYDETALNAAAKVDKTAFAGFLGWIQGEFGAYPFGQSLRFVLGPTYWWGFEHPGNVALAESLVNAVGSYQDPLLHVMMHETAHQWAGNETTLADVYDFVWKEAMAEYLSYLYETKALDPNYAKRTLAVWTSNSIGMRYYPVPEDTPSVFDYYGDVYGPGPMVLFRQLEVLFGQDKIEAALKQVLGSPRFLSVAELQGALEATTGADLDQYFDEWVYGSGAPKWPVVSVSYSDPEGDGTYAIQLSQVQGNGVVYGFKSTLRLKGAAGATFDLPFSYGVDGVNATLDLSAKPGFVVTAVEIDPFDEALVTQQGRTLEAARFDFRPF